MHTLQGRFTRFEQSCLRGRSGPSPPEASGLVLLYAHIRSSPVMLCSPRLSWWAALASRTGAIFLHRIAGFYYNKGAIALP